MKVCVIGHFGGNKRRNDGQTIKTVTFYEALRRADVAKVERVDTYYIKRNPLRFCASLIGAVLRNQKIVVLLSRNGRKVLFPILSLFSRLGKEVYHYGIGGRLAKEVSAKPRWKQYVSSFQGNWMESRELVEQLHALGVSNACYIPNFKTLSIPKEITRQANAPYRFCTFSRVVVEKGIEDAIDAIQEVNRRLGVGTATLDIYGAIEPSYEKRLQECLEQTEGVCRYCGVVDANKSVAVLKEYDMLLFPTHWRHEGIPGTIIDALTAGLPVIARRWQYCDEMLTDGETGYVYDFDHPELLVEKICYGIAHKEQLVTMQKNCMERAYLYSEEFVMQQILKEMHLQSNKGQ